MDIKEALKELKDIKESLQSPPVVGKFHKVSFEQFSKDYHDDNIDEQEYIYNEILRLPVRGSTGSAGHDFVLTRDIVLEPGQSVQIATGIRAQIEKGWVLMLKPRSGLGSKFRMQLNNTTGVIDEDYFGADNEGHIKATITNDSKDGKVLALSAGDRFIQGVFLPYGITEDDNVKDKRTGGHGSTGLK